HELLDVPHPPRRLPGRSFRGRKPPPARRWTRAAGGGSAHRGGARGRTAGVDRARLERERNLVLSRARRRAAARLAPVPHPVLTQPTLAVRVISPMRPLWSSWNAAISWASLFMPNGP